MIKETIIPITWNQWDEMDVNEVNFYDVEFTENFGVFEKGEKCETLFVSYKDGKLESYDKCGENVVKTQKFIGKPI